MEENKKTFDLVVAELIMRITAMERILISKNIMSMSEIDEEVKKISEQVINQLKFNAAKIKN